MFMTKIRFHWQSFIVYKNRENTDRNILPKT